MRYIACDCCGKTFNESGVGADPVITYFKDLDFCSECTKDVLQPAWADLLKKVNNDMKAFLDKQYEVARQCAKKRISDKKK